MSSTLDLIIIGSNCYEAHVVFNECNNKISASQKLNQMLHLM